MWKPGIFLIFQNILGTKNFRNHRNFFSSSAKFYFLQKVRYIKWSLLSFEVVILWYFLKDLAGFCSLITVKLKKVLTPLLASFTLSKNKNAEASRLIGGLSLSFQCYICLSVWCVCLVHLQHFHQYYLCFTGRTSTTE